MSTGKIRVASCQFAESFNVRRNAAVVLRYMAKAKARRAELVHIHEAAMTGYLAREDAPPPDDAPWAALREATDSICAEAKPAPFVSKSYRPPYDASALSTPIPLTGWLP